jgi:ribonucleoside-diphosphate reductase alpha chain
MGTSADNRYEERSRKVGPGRAHGYEKEQCQECGNFTLVRNGDELKCDRCGTTTGKPEQDGPEADRHA